MLRAMKKRHSRKMKWDADLAGKKIDIGLDDQKTDAKFTQEERNLADKTMLEALARKQKELQSKRS